MNAAPARSNTHLSGDSASAAAKVKSEETERRVLALLDEFLHAHQDDAVAWIACGPLWQEYVVKADADVWSQPPPSSSFSAARRAGPIFEALLRAAQIRSRYQVTADAIVAASTTNQKRAVAPLLPASAGAVRATKAPLHAPFAPFVRLAAVARGHAEAINSGLRSADIAFPGGSLTAYRLFTAAAVHLAYSRRLIERVSPSVVVITSNHDVASRALACAARERDVPSVLVPHAPLLGDMRLRDAPTDYVAVRGEREAAWYRGNGVEPDQVAVVGDAALQPEPQFVPIPTSAPVVFAPSPYADAVVASHVALLSAATDGDVVVTPHPRQRLEFLRETAPQHWAFHSGRTYTRLREGAIAVVQSSSGVALESLLLGIPVLEIEPAGGSTYPFLQSDLVPSVRTPEELAGQLELIRARIADRAYRERLAEYARTWCSAGGETAAQNMLGFVRRAAAEGKRSRLAHDAWRASDREGT
jgi:hypothetical protein